MFKLIKSIFYKKKVEEKPKKDPLERKLQKQRIKRRKALRKNKAARRSYRESVGERVVPKHRKNYNQPQDAKQSWYYQTYLKDKENH